MTSRIPGGVLDGVKEVLNLPNLSSIREFLLAAGGSINQGGKLKTTIGQFFPEMERRQKVSSDV